MCLLLSVSSVVTIVKWSYAPWKICTLAYKLVPFGMGGGGIRISEYILIILYYIGLLRWEISEIQVVRFHEPHSLRD